MLLIALQEAAKKAADVPPQQSTSTVTMNPLLWIGFGFMVALVAFFMWTIKSPPENNSLTRKAMHFLTALCGGFSAGFITGGALLDVTWTQGPTKVGISATAGFALAILTWWGYSKIPEGGEVTFKPTIGIGKNWSLEQAATTIAGSLKSAVNFGNLTAAEKGAKLSS